MFEETRTTTRRNVYKISVFLQVLPAPSLRLLIQMRMKAQKVTLKKIYIILEWAENRSCGVHVCLLNTTAMLATVVECLAIPEQLTRSYY